MYLKSFGTEHNSHGHYPQGAMAEVKIHRLTDWGRCCERKIRELSREPVEDFSKKVVLSWDLKGQVSEKALSGKKSGIRGNPRKV